MSHKEMPHKKWYGNGKLNLLEVMQRISKCIIGNDDFQSVM